METVIRTRAKELIHKIKILNTKRSPVLKSDTGRIFFFSEFFSYYSLVNWSFIHFFIYTLYLNVYTFTFFHIYIVHFLCFSKFSFVNLFIDYWSFHSLNPILVYSIISFFKTNSFLKKSQFYKQNCGGLHKNAPTVVMQILDYFDFSKYRRPFNFN